MHFCVWHCVWVYGRIETSGLTGCFFLLGRQELSAGGGARGVAGGDGQSEGVRIARICPPAALDHVRDPARQHPLQAPGASRLIRCNPPWTRQTCCEPTFKTAFSPVCMSDVTHVKQLPL